MDSDAGAHAPGGHVEIWVPTPTSGIRRLAPEVKGLIFSHLEGDIASLRSCTLVCASWAALTRPHLFRKVVCRPAVPTRTWHDFSRFLTTSPHVTRHIRWLTVDGHISYPGQISDLVLEYIVEALDMIPSLTRLYIQRAKFDSTTPEPVPGSTRAEAMFSARLRCRRPVSLKVLSVSSCRVDSLVPLYQLLASIVRIETLVLHGLRLIDSYEQPGPAPLAIRIGTIQVDGYPLGAQFWACLRHRLPSRAAPGLRASTRLIGGPVAVSTRFICGQWAVTSLMELLTAFGTDVHSVSVNVLGSSCHELSEVVTGVPVWPPPTNALPMATAFPRDSEFPDFPRVDMSPFNSIREIVLYVTTTSAVSAGSFGIRLYGRILENNWSLLSNAPTSLRHIELRFQRYGPHIRSMLDDLRAIEDPSAYPEQGPPPWSMADEKILASLPPHNRALIYQRRAAQAAAPPRTRWSTFDEGTLARFPSLEAFTCVICDGGFVDQYGPFVGQGVQMVPQAPSCSRQQEFDGFVELLKGVLPRLHERGLLRFRMSDI